ncbi:developmentally-regulated GTP-binding protein (macronuclear) [Tetrahymena thermophila SB210]|uniref:Developmentally-regulated GTP-binding protein n=1 Tax=Tetrahymena thermophila (strain SB210) TaxID=312017 RepID=Q24D67_TETTS|nr:developmentally-regulated GTP-binding protein [Tetrahymena thermophila SB210]EAS05722.2 developmentally-regulated GTP-binding protein [Tetrahymena thermophila SB210]|eukprot:XP_001025967.2 developmentally-regulated GTP-binding protein [Tetrahymena thermophila SB210]
MTTAQKIAEVELEMERTQKNKATSYHLGQLKAKLAKLKRELIEGGKGKSGPVGEGFDVSKSGDARVGMIGFPSVGKSTLLTKLTGTESKIAAYEFTTLTCIPGNVFYKGSKIQLLDLPGIIEGAKDGKGRGKQVIAVARTCNLICIVLDATKPMKHKKIIEGELEGFGIRLNKQPPKVDFKIKPKGGINITHMVENPDLDDEMIKTILKEYRINSVDIVFREKINEDQLIDIIEGNRKYIPCLYVMNKIDDLTMEELDIIDQIPHYVPISAHLEWNLDELIERMWEYLDLYRVYTKPKGKAPDYEKPVILPRKKSTVEDFCMRIHRTMINDMKYALVWGTSVKHNPQVCGKDHQLNDEDIVQIIKKI